MVIFGHTVFSRKKDLKGTIVNQPITGYKWRIENKNMFSLFKVSHKEDYLNYLNSDLSWILFRFDNYSELDWILFRLDNYSELDWILFRLDNYSELD